MQRDLNDLEIFRAVVEHGSFTRAARKLALPVSTVSRRIARLEDSLQVRLLQRTTRRLSLTDAGRIYHERVSRTLEELKSVERELSACRAEPQGRVRLSAPADVVSLVGVLADFLDLYPQVRVDLDLSNRRVDLVAEEFDVALRGGALADSTLVAHQLLGGHLLLVASPSYLEKRGVPREAKDLTQHACVLQSRTSDGTTWTLGSGNRTVRVPVQGRLATNHLTGVLSATLRGLGIALVPSTAAERYLQSGALRQVLPELRVEGGGLHIVYPSRRYLAPAVRALVDYLKTHFSEALVSAGV